MYKLFNSFGIFHKNLKLIHKSFKPFVRNNNNDNLNNDEKMRSINIDNEFNENKNERILYDISDPEDEIFTKIENIEVIENQIKKDDIMNEIEKRNKKLNEKKKKEYNPKALDELKRIVESDNNEKLEFKDLNLYHKGKTEEIQETTQNEYLVKRPSKNFVWGLGQQTKQRKFKFVKGEYPSIDSIVNFLEINNLKDIVVVPTHKLGLNHLKENSILCSGFTQKHIYKTAKDFIVELKKLNIPYLTTLPVIYGRREDEWLLVEIGNISTHFFVESFRKEQDLLEIWMNPINDEQMEWNKRLLNKIYNKY